VLSLFQDNQKIRKPISRRAMLQVGSAFGLSCLGLQQAIAAAPKSKTTSAGNRSFGKAKSCILLFMAGGPPQHETWDPKPDAPAHIRGDIGSIKSSLPGLRVGELMPNLAKQAHKWSILKAARTEDNAHSASGYYMLTGQPHQPKGQENATPKDPNRWPCIGAVTNHLLPQKTALPGTVTLPEHIWNTGMIPWPGQDAGFLGRTVDPWLLHCNPNQPKFNVSGLTLPPGIDQLRLKKRLSLHKQLNKHLDKFARFNDLQGHDVWTQTAIDLLGATGSRKAFDLSQETKQQRDSYGRHRFGQSVLLARRLVESGVSLIQVNWTRDKDGTNDSPMWDTHRKNSYWLKKSLMPPMDLACSALINDLETKGLLDETLVVWMGEFGRSPKINTNGGRDHWGNVFSVAMAGGGVKQGHVHGQSDQVGGEPKSGTVKPEDIIATIFHCLGLSPEQTITDHQGRPHPITRGHPIKQILL
jgi:hypothetical protein